MKSTLKISTGIPKTYDQSGFEELHYTEIADVVHLEYATLLKRYPMRVLSTTGETVYFDVEEMEIQNVINQLTEILEKNK